MSIARCGERRRKKLWKWRQCQGSTSIVPSSSYKFLETAELMQKEQEKRYLASIQAALFAQHCSRTANIIRSAPHIQSPFMQMQSGIRRVASMLGSIKTRLQGVYRQVTQSIFRISHRLLEKPSVLSQDTGSLGPIGVTLSLDFQRHLAESQDLLKNFQGTTVTSTSEQPNSYSVPFRPSPTKKGKRKGRKQKPAISSSQTVAPITDSQVNWEWTNPKPKSSSQSSGKDIPRSKSGSKKKRKNADVQGTHSLNSDGVCTSPLCISRVSGELGNVGKKEPVRIAGSGKKRKERP